MVKHPVILRGYHAEVNEHTAAPVLVKRLDQEFIPGVLEGFRRKLTPQAMGRLGAADAHPKAADAYRLFQPVHRTFNLVLLEAVCDSPGSPRLNPRDIASAGFVIRRLRNGTDEAWMLREDHVLGWGAPADPKLDPDARQRRPRLNAGNPHMNGKLARLHAALEPPAERVSPLFVAPPDICAEAGRTLLYGLVPVTSAERSEDAQPVEVDPDDVDATMPEFLRVRANTATYPIPSTLSLTAIDVRLRDFPNDALSAFVQDLRLIQFGWRVFDSPQGAILFGLLNNISLEFPGPDSRLGDYLRELCRHVILREASASGVRLPTAWPRPDAALAARIRDAAQQSLQASISTGLPNEQRFDRPDAIYRIHAFMRVRSPDGCPPHLQWSQPSARFGIVPWWESGGGGPLHTITLPDIDADSVKQIRPNVAFALPPKLAALLKNNTPKKFMDGEAEIGGVGIGWICSFSIPIITLCAFIVLNIFLALLHIVFQWLFYIKICLPYPKKT